MSGFNISDADGDIPRSRRAGLPIPPEVRKAVDESLKTGKSKRVDVPSEDCANQVLAYLRSLSNREGYKFEQGKERDGDNNTTAVVFKTVDKDEPKRKRTSSQT
ncbi:hypothetical protein HUO13_26175 [Saccharopolyspora erythraea]|uniref:hypothetical protein n=1 Tax=Saccharopolyspora erythraea TaxID=1836 RepID=UPI001BA69CF3|nr:hypothetical protein [Saccharopolyspora erythraea]QUH03838.1 hypothetical protein HUO13_26175 [Saccharopolyspora erythraea]